MKQKTGSLLFFAFISYVMFRSIQEFQKIAWDTGIWWGRYSLSWGILYAVYILFCVFVAVLAGLAIWRTEKIQHLFTGIIFVRERFGIIRWLLFALILFFPVWFFQYTSWGFVFQKLYTRIFIWIITICLLTIISSRNDQLAGWSEFLASMILTASAFSIAASLKYVNNYPFSLGWSEGNRLWDYSVLFGRDIYIFPPDRKIPVFLDFGRRLIGGLPFIFPGITITIARLWVGLIQIIPYLLLGLALFRFSAKSKLSWLLLMLWTFLFLKQGPIHPPLVLGAVLVALAWQTPLWYAIPLVVGAGYFVESSRFTWIFAPGIWIFMLEFLSASFSNRKPVSAIWKRSLLLGIFGIFGGFVLPNLIGSAGRLIPASMLTAATPVATAIAQAPLVVTATPVVAATVGNSNPTFLDSIIRVIKVQPLLWYRLLPNSTYGNGILFALLLAITPLLIILIYLSVKKLWLLSRLQKLALIFPLFAFLVVGLVVSVKIGGGGDLHNMDMFLIGLLFTGALAWQNGGRDWLQSSQSIPSLMKVVIVILLVNSSIAPLLEMRSFSFGEEAFRLTTLTDSASESDLGMLPVQEEVDSALYIIQSEVDKAKLQGEVLFMDQRQLLTFGYITGVPLVPDYEKKLLMNQALTGDPRYFDGFYADLAAQRFSLIVTEPLHTPVQDTSFQFGEENNAWVKWVSGPVLCYYEPLTTIKNVRVQLLVPSKTVSDCSHLLP